MSETSLLTVLTHAPAHAVKALAEGLLDTLGEVCVLINRTGLVMLPYTDSAHGTRFHLGEVLVSESQVRLDSGAEGYGVVLGRDLEHSLAVAILDAAWRAGQHREQIEAFAGAQAAAQQAADDALLRQVEATRIELETF
jgi:alpha-D-ribose 1-methylphosphonate 5-triphosphate synthase subunit PhnG